MVVGGEVVGGDGGLVAEGGIVASVGVAAQVVTRKEVVRADRPSRPNGSGALAGTVPT